MKYAKQIFVAIILASLLACSGTTTKSSGEPDWVSGNSSKYSNQQYLLGRGQADDVATAEDRARADLAKIFVVKVNVADVDKQKFTSTTSSTETEGKPVSEFSSEVSRTIVTSTDKILKGVQIADIWKDQTKQTVNALAILSRKQAATGIKREISRLDDLTRLSIEEAGNAKESLEKVAYARRAVIAQQERLAHQKSLQIIDSSGRGLPAKYQLAELIIDYEKLLPRVRIKPVVLGDNQDIIASALPAALSSAGFSVTDSDDAEYVMEVNLKLADTFEKESWFWGRGLLIITLLDRQNIVHGKKEWPIKVSAREQAQVMMRAERKADDILQQDLLATMVGFTQVGSATGN